MSTSDKPLHMDIPVTLTDVKVPFSVASLAFEGDLPASIFHLQLIDNDIDSWSAKSQVIAVFHTNAGHVTLNDKAYNADRNVATGNLYKKLLSDLMNRGVKVEVCGATAKAHHWGNEDVLPEIKINTDAISNNTFNAGGDYWYITPTLYNCRRTFHRCWNVGFPGSACGRRWNHRRNQKCGRNGRHHDCSPPTQCQRTNGFRG